MVAARPAGSGTPSADDPILVPDPTVKNAVTPKPAGAKQTKQAAAAAVKGVSRTDDGLQGDERSLTAELEAEKAAKNAKDVLLNEAVHILADEVGLLKTDTRLARFVDSTAVTRKNMKDTRISLNEAVRKKELEEAEKKAAAAKLDTKIVGKEQPRSNDLRELGDEYLREGLFVLGDLITSKIG